MRPEYLDPDFEAIIRDALLFYAKYCGDLSDYEHQEALNWHRALGTDTWLLSSTTGPDDGLD